MSNLGRFLFHMGTASTFTITPNNNRNIVSVVVDGTASTRLPLAINVGYTYTFTNVIADHTHRCNI